MSGCFKKNRDIIQDNASEQKKKKPRLKFNPGSALTDLRATRPRDRRLHQFRRPKFEFDSARIKYSVCTGPKYRFFSLPVWWYRGAPFDGWRCCVVQQTTFSSQTQHHGSPGLCLKEFNFLVFLRIYPKGPCRVVCYLFKRWKRFFASVEFQNNGPILLFKIMYSKFVSCRLLQRMARIDMDWNLRKLG